MRDMFVNNNAKWGIFWALLLNCISSLNDVLAKLLSDNLHFIEVAFFRFLFSTITVVIAIIFRSIIQFSSNNGDNENLFKTLHHRGHLARGILGSVAIGLCCFSVHSLPLAENTTILFSDTLFMLPLSTLFLREKIELKSCVATLIGFTGLIIIYRPTALSLNIYALYPTIAALLFAIMNIMIKKLIECRENSLTMLFYFGLYTTIISGILVPFYWKIPKTSDLWLLALLGTGSNLIQVCLFLAYKATKASIISPIRYSELPFALIFGFMFFGQIPDLTSTIGSGLVVIGTAFALASSKKHLG